MVAVCEGSYALFHHEFIDFPESGVTCPLVLKFLVITLFCGLTGNAIFLKEVSDCFYQCPEDIPKYKETLT